MFGHYTMDGDILKGGTLRINYEYLINIFSRVNKTIGISDKQLNDVININFLEMLSHELGHAMDMQNFFKITENLDAVDWLMTTYTNKQCNYNLRSTELQDKMGTKEYRKHHNIFITEVQADLFAFFDSNKQLITNFNNCYPKYIVENSLSAYAKRIVSFYTSEEGAMLSPMEKFDKIYQENMGSDAIPIVTEENPDVWDSLMTGDKIPEDLWNLLKRIANKEIRTTNLYEILNTYVQNRANATYEENLSNPYL